MSNILNVEASEFLKAHRNSVLSTVDGDEPSSRVMYIAQIDDDGTIWYASGKSSAKMSHITANPKVCVAVSTGAKSLRLFGNAEIIDDPVVKSNLWQPTWITYFKDANDPEFSIIKVTPYRVEFI
jgi:general stress protein 26